MKERDIKLILKCANDALHDSQNVDSYLYAIINKCIKILPL